MIKIEPLVFAAGVGGIISLSATVARACGASEKLVNHLNAAATAIGSATAVFASNQAPITAVLSLLGGGVAYGSHLLGQKLTSKKAATTNNGKA